MQHEWPQPATTRPVAQQGDEHATLVDARAAPAVHRDPAATAVACTWPRLALLCVACVLQGPSSQQRHRDERYVPGSSSSSSVGVQRRPAPRGNEALRSNGNARPVPDRLSTMMLYFATPLTLRRRHRLWQAG